jgi:hypothetical protein
MMTAFKKQIYFTFMTELTKHNITWLAMRTGATQERIVELLDNPEAWEINDVSDMFLALGGELQFTLQEAQSNQATPENGGK